MHHKKILVVLLFISILFNCQKTELVSTTISIIPQPNHLNLADGTFVLNNAVGIQYDKTFSISAEFLKSFIEEGSGISLEGDSGIHFIKDDNLAGEAYTMNISPSTIEIKAKTDRGAFYAVQSLRQVLPATFENGTFEGNQITIPSVTIKDEPQFEYRGMHLDVGRHMYSVDFIKKYIDALALLKMNTFHWHLTEDQGWRIEIKKYPKLQEIAAYRNETLIGHYSDQPHQFDGKIYGGYYTQDEVKAIVAYAQNRFVTVIPEIELPGHAQAAIAAYPELGCTEKQVDVVTNWGVYEEIYCPKEDTFTFLENVFDEVLALFPSEYIHIGGDEAPKTRWQNCEHCQALIQKEGLKDEHELQNYFITRIEKYLNSKGRQIIGWDEILEGGLAPNATVMSWRGMDGAIEAAKQHHKVITTPTSHSYFDYYQSENNNEPLAIGGYLPLEKVYNFNPIPEELTTEESKYVLGAQGNLWTEYIPTSKQVEYMVFPRILAMSEVVWTNPEQKNYKDFVSRVEHLHQRLEALDINYANHLYEIEGELISNNKQLTYQLQTLTKDKTIRYTLDGTEPHLDSEVYSDQIVITKNINLKAAVFNDMAKLGTTFSQDIMMHKAVGKKITIDKAAHKSYPGSGPKGLINGISGSVSRFGDKEWLGFWGDDIEITIDLGAETNINSIEMRFNNSKGQWIYAPKELEVDFGNETEKLNFKVLNSNENLVNVKIDTTIKVKVITIKIPNYGIIPEGKQGTGQMAWTFIDEIIIN